MSVLCLTEAAQQEGPTSSLPSLLFLSPQLPVLSTPGDAQLQPASAFFTNQKPLPFCKCSCDPRICVRQENFWNPSKQS